MRNLVEQPHILMSVENAYHDASAPLVHDEAMQILSGGGKYGNVYPAKGKYGSKENTIFISNPSEAQRALAHKVAEGAGQDSLIESDGFSHKMIFVNGPNKGSVTHGKGTTWHEQEPEDYYTTLPTGEHFTHNFDSSEQDVTKSEGLEKSKNVREQRAKVFGTDPNAPRVSNKRMKMMQAIQGYAQKKYGLPLVTASGKRDASGQLKEEKGIEQQPYDVFSPKGVAEEKVRQEKVKQLGLKRVDPKPDWRSGQLETQPSPDAAVHELAHLDLAPEQMTAPEFQKEMDRRWGESQKKYGHMQQKKTQWEIQPMSLENPIRRELGLPANRATKPVSEGQAAIDDPTQQRFIQGKDSQGRTVFYDRQSRLMNPETKERLAQIREGSLKFDPKSGWQPSSDVNALINLRGRGMAEEARARSKQRFSQSSQPQQASGEEVTLNDLLSHQGSVEELKEKIKQFSQQPKKLAANEEMSKAEQLRKRCWAGYKAIPGKKPYSKGSCAPVEKNEDLEKAKSDKPFHGYSKKKHSRTGGLSDSYRKKYNRETGSNLKRPVTGKVKAGSKAAKRRKSFCARMSGVKGPTSKEGKLTPKGAALKRWKCSKSEELEKGSMQRLYPVPRTPQKPSGVAEWLQGGGDRDDVPREGDQNRRSRMLHKLSGLTKVRQRPDGTREFLLHRGENPEAYNVLLPSRSDPFLTHSEKTSWTPFFDQAYGHARDQIDEGDFKATHAVHSAWIHEDNIRNIPLHYGALEDDKKDQNEWRGEHEVVVEPWHNSELLNSYDVTNEMPFRMPTSQDQVEMQRQSQGKLRHPTIDEKINARAGKALSANKNPTKLAASELEKARLEHYSSKQGLRSIDPKFKGTGVDVRTKGRDTEHPHSFFYRAGTTPEEIVSGQAKSKYTVNIPDEMPLYDLATDNEGHIASAVEQNQGALNMDMVHQRLKDAGYQGFYNSAHPQLSNVVALYHEQPVSEEEGMGKSWYNSSYSSKKRKAELQIDKQKHPEKYNINNEEINRKIAEEFLSSKKDHENPLKNKKQPVQKQEGTDCDDHLDPLKKPYASEAQRRWAHTEAGTKALGGKKAVAHWDEQSRGRDLPEKVKKKDYSLEKVSRADVASSHILMFPVSINGQRRDDHEDLPDYHVTLKWMGETPHKTVDEIENIVNKHGLSAPKSFNIRPHVFNTPNGPAHVLLLGGNLETLHNAKKEIDEGKPDRYPEYLPHITVSKKIHDAIKNGTMSAEDLNIRVHPLEYRIGDQIVKRFDSTR